MKFQNQEQKSKNKSGLRPDMNRKIIIILICAAVTVLIVFAVAVLCTTPTEHNSDVTETEASSEISHIELTTEDETPSASLTTEKISSVPATKNELITSPATNNGGAGDIVCNELGNYSGIYVEDGSDEPVENVAAVRVTNRTDRFLDFAEITVNINGKAATFIVTGLPARRSAWVLEANRMTIGETADFEIADCVSSFRDDVIAETDKVKITADGNMLTVTNTASQTLQNVAVYYRTLHTDGRFLGGITYKVSAGTLEAGESATVIAGHYETGTSEIVRIGWQAQ